MHSLPLADTNWTVEGNVNGEAMQCIGTYLASYQPVKCILVRLEGALIISNR